LFRNQLKIGLGPDRLLLAGHGRGFQKAAGKNGMMSVEASRGLADWRAAVEALPAAISMSELHRPEVTVVLSNHFVRYALLPANTALRKDEEWLAFAHHRLAAVHGPAMGEWTLRVSASGPDGSRVVSAAESALIEEVRAKTAECGAKLVSLQPNLMASFNAVRKDVGRESCWLAIRETGRLTLALLERGTWRAIRTRRVDDGWRMPLQEILERESALLALPQPYTRAVLFMKEDFAIHREDALHVPDWTLAGEDDFQVPAVLAGAGRP
jgi:hypothetical protein